MQRAITSNRNIFSSICYKQIIGKQSLFEIGAWRFLIKACENKIINGKNSLYNFKKAWTSLKQRGKKDVEGTVIVRDTLRSNENHYSHPGRPVYSELLPSAGWPVCDTIRGISWPPSCCSGPARPVRRPVDVPLIKCWGLLFQGASSFLYRTVQLWGPRAGHETPSGHMH